MSFGRTLAAKSLLVISIPLSFQIMMVLTLGGLQVRAEQSVRAVQKSLQLSQTLSAVLRDLTEIRVESMRSGIKYIVSRKLLATQRHGVEQLEKLKQLLRDQPEKKNVIISVEEHARSGPHLLENVGASDYIATLDHLVRQLVFDSSCLAILVNDEEKVATAAMQLQKDRDIWYQIILCGGTATELGLLTVAFFWLRRDITQRLTVMKENSLLVIMGKPLHPQIEGSDELTQLDQVFHAMAEELSEASQIDNVLIENVRAVVCSLDSKLTFKESNSASLVVLGYSADDLIGTRLASLLPQAQLAETIERFENAKSGVQGPFETQMLNKNGTTIETLWSVTWSNDDGSFFCVIHDNTAGKEIDRQREGLLQMVGSDLRQPLTAIDNVLHALRQETYGPLSERGKKLAATAASATGQMLAITNDLLELNHLEAGTLQIFPELVSVSQLFQQAVDASSGLARNFDIELEQKPSDLHIFVDPRRMLQVLTNLISNAVKFSPRGSMVTIESSAVGVGVGVGVEIRVIDRGRGIPSNAMSSIFDRFRQTDESDASEMKGVGLGLAITKELVILLGGKIAVRSVPGEGSTFTVHLPAPNGSVPVEVKNKK